MFILLYLNGVVISITAFRSEDTWRRPCRGGFRSGGRGPEQCPIPHPGRCFPTDKSLGVGSSGNTIAPQALNLPSRSAQDSLSNASPAHLFSENAVQCKPSPRRSGWNKVNLKL